MVARFARPIALLARPREEQEVGLAPERVADQERERRQQAGERRTGRDLRQGGQEPDQRGEDRRDAARQHRGAVEVGPRRRPSGQRAPAVGAAELAERMQQPGGRREHHLPEAEERDAEDQRADARQQVAAAVQRILGRGAVRPSPVVGLAAQEEHRRRDRQRHRAGIAGQVLPDGRRDRLHLERAGGDGGELEADAHAEADRVADVVVSARSCKPRPDRCHRIEDAADRAACAEIGPSARPRIHHHPCHAILPLSPRSDLAAAWVTE